MTALLSRYSPVSLRGFYREFRGAFQNLRCSLRSSLLESAKSSQSHGIVLRALWQWCLSVTETFLSALVGMRVVTRSRDRSRPGSAGRRRWFRKTASSREYRGVSSIFAFVSAIMDGLCRDISQRVLGRSRVWIPPKPGSAIVLLSGWEGRPSSLCGCVKTCGDVVNEEEVD